MEYRSLQSAYVKGPYSKFKQENDQEQVLARTLNFSAQISGFLFPFLNIIKIFKDKNNLDFNKIHLKEFYRKLQELNKYDELIVEYRKHFKSYAMSIKQKLEIASKFQREAVPRVSFILKLPEYVRQKFQISNNVQDQIVKEKIEGVNKDISSEVAKPAQPVKLKKKLPQKKRLPSIIVKDFNKKNPLAENLIDKNQDLKADYSSLPNAITINLNENEEDKMPLVTDSAVSLEEVDQNNYKEMLRYIFKELTDIRENIFEDLVIADSNFKENDFEQFVKYFEYVIYIFTNLKCLYSIDEVGNLSLDFYAENEITYVRIAEHMNYHLNTKIFDNCYEYNFEDSEINKQNKKLAQEKISDLRYKQLENYNPDEIPLYTPYVKCTVNRINIFRRFDQKDNFHECGICKDVISTQKCANLRCSSIFRNIDKERLVLFSLDSILKLDKINHYETLFKYFLIAHSYTEYNEEFRYRNIYQSYKTLWYDCDVNLKRMNKNFRNFYGEEVGFYFEWISHFISWMTIPTLIGLIINLIVFIIKLYNYVYIQDNHYNAYLDILFTCIIIIWGSLLSFSWNDNQKFLNLTWGMDEYNTEEILNSSSNKKRLYFLDFFINQEDGLKPLIKQVVTTFLIILMVGISIASNLFLFYLEYYYRENPSISKIFFYLVPVCIYFIRDFLTAQFYKIAVILTKWGDLTNKMAYRNSFVKKVILFEFFNYYFNLYFIAFIKGYISICADNDCFYELGNQLFIIQLTSIIHDLGNLLFYLFVEYKNKNKIIKEIEEAKKKKNIENKLKDQRGNEYIQNVADDHADFDDETLTKHNRSKIQYYIRSKYKWESVEKEYIEVVMNYGYVIQFGAASPICFLFALLHAYISRLIDAFKMAQLQYVHIIDGSQGIGIISKVLSLFTFIGLITNISVNLYTNENMSSVNEDHKWVILIITENMIVFLLFFISFKGLPFWYDFKDKIKNAFITKFVNAKSNLKVSYFTPR